MVKLAKMKKKKLKKILGYQGFFRQFIKEGSRLLGMDLISTIIFEKRTLLFLEKAVYI